MSAIDIKNLGVFSKEIIKEMEDFLDIEIKPKFKNAHVNVARSVLESQIPVVAFLICKVEKLQKEIDLLKKGEI